MIPRWTVSFVALAGVVAAVAYGLSRSSDGVPPLTIVDRDALEVGTRICGQTTPGRFELRNAGDRPITVQSLRKYCGCLQVDAGELPRAMDPGQSVAVRFELSPADKEGEIAQAIDLECEEFESPYRVMIRGRSQFPLPAEISLGSIDAPYETTVEFRADAHSCGCKIQRVRSFDSELMVQPNPGGLHIAVADAAVGKRIDTAVDVFYRQCSTSRQRIRVRGSASGGLTARPDTIQFGRLRVGSVPAGFEVVVTDVKNRPFDITTTGVTTDIIEAEVIEKEPARTRLRITCLPRAAQAIDAQVRVQTSDPRRAVCIRCVGVIEDFRAVSDSSVSDESPPAVLVDSRKE